MHAEPCWKCLDWKKELANNVVSIDQLKEYASFSADEEVTLREVAKVHPINIPRYYLSLIDKDDPADPIRRMCFPDAEEMVVAGSMGATTADPYGDDKHDKGNGMLHKYDCTALLVATEWGIRASRPCATLPGHCNTLPTTPISTTSSFLAATRLR